MVDTVTFFCLRVLQTHIHEALVRCNRYEDDDITASWDYGKSPRNRRDYMVARDGTLFPMLKVVFKKYPKGIVATGWGPWLDTVTAQLPAVIHGSNGKIIRNQRELNHAWIKTHEVLNSVSSVKVAVLAIARVDVTLQVSIPCDLIFSCHKNLRMPGIRKNAVVYPKNRAGGFEIQTLKWPGRNLAVTIYDKEFQAVDEFEGHRRPCNRVLRIELSLRNSTAVRNLFNYDKGENPVALTFPALYALLRRYLSKVQTEIKETKWTLSFLLAHIDSLETSILAKTGNLPGAVRTLDRYYAEHSGERNRKIRAEVAKHQMKKEHFSWENLLPESAPPEQVDVYPFGKVETVQDPICPAEYRMVANDYGFALEPIMLNS